MSAASGTGAARRAGTTSATTAVSGPPAGEPAPAPAPPAPAWGIRPALSGLTTLPGGHFTYALPAGASISDALLLQNETAAPLTLQVYPADLLASRGGGFAPGQRGQPLHGAGAWLRVARSAVTLAVQATGRDPFALSVPSGTAPGVYRAAVVAAADDGRTPAGIAIQARTALIVHVTVVAHPSPGLAVGPLAVVPDGSGLRATLTLRDTGNVTLQVRRAATEVRRGGGRPGGTGPARGIALGPPGVYLVPGGTAVLHGRLPPPDGALDALPVVVAQPPGGPPRAYRGSAVALGAPRVATPAGPATDLPWALVAAAAVAAAGAAAAWVAARRRGRP